MRILDLTRQSRQMYKTSLLCVSHLYFAAIVPTFPLWNSEFRDNQEAENSANSIISYFQVTFLNVRIYENKLSVLN